MYSYCLPGNEVCFHPGATRPTEGGEGKADVCGGGGRDDVEIRGGLGNNGASPVGLSSNEFLPFRKDDDGLTT